MAEFIQDQGITFPVLHDNMNVYGRFGVPGSTSPYPRDFVVDAEGVVRLAKAEYDPAAMIRTIEDLLHIPTSVGGGMDAADPVPHNGLLVRAFPNPFNPDVVLEITLESRDVLTAGIYDLKGREVKRILDPESYPGGSHLISIDADGLNSGVYVIRVQGDQQQVFTKVVKLN